MSSLELDDDLVDRQALARGGRDLLDLAVALGARHVLDRLGLHYGQLLAGLDALALGDSRNFYMLGGVLTGINPASAPTTRLTTRISVAAPEWKSVQESRRGRSAG